jgi:hypothetical protein
MSRRDFIRFMRALGATLAAGVVTYILARLGVTITIPHP